MGSSWIDWRSFCYSTGKLVGVNKKLKTKKIRLRDSKNQLETAVSTNNSKSPIDWRHFILVLPWLLLNVLRVARASMQRRRCQKSTSSEFKSRCQAKGYGNTWPQNRFSPPWAGVEVLTLKKLSRLCKSRLKRSDAGELFLLKQRP